MLSTDEFKAFAQKVVPFLSMQTNIEGRKDDKLLRAYGYGGFPSLAFLDADGNKLMTQRARSVEGFDESLVKVDAFVKLLAKGDAGDPEAYAEALLTQMKWSVVDFKRAQAKSKKAKFSKEQKAAYIEALIPLLTTLPFDVAKIELKNLKLSDSQHAKAMDIVNGLEITGLLKGSRADRGAAAMEAFYKMWKEGRAPKEVNSRPKSMFWSYLLRKAAKDGDAELFEAAWGKVRPLAARNPRATRYVEMQDAKLEELKKQNADKDKDSDDGDSGEKK